MNFRRGHDLPKTDMKKGSIPVVGSNGVIGYHDISTTPAPCLTIGRSGNVGNPLLLDQDCWAHNTTLYVDDFKDNDPIFLFYLLKTLNLANMSGGSAVPTLNRNHIHPLLIYTTKKYKVQRAIAATLSCLDDKIELNNKINANLEAQAQAIFKSWFVDFEPFQDGEFADSELGMIPKGWRVGKLGEIIRIIDNRGKTPPLANGPTEFPIIDVKALAGNNRIVDYNNCTKFVDEITYSNWFRSGHPNPYDILLSTVGSLAEIKLFLGAVGCVAQNVVAFRSIPNISLYLYEYLRYIKKDLISYDIGSVQPSIKVTHIIKHPILLPPDDIMRSFDDVSHSITSQIYNNCLQSRTLAALRDALLPKLMSGEIEVPLAE